MTKQKFIPYGRHDINEEDIQSVVDVLRSDFLTAGPKVPEFEAALGRAVNSEYTIVCSNGTTALHLVFAAMGIGEGDAVIVPPLTFAATANAVLYCGGTPVFADIDETRCLSPNSLLEAIKFATAHNLKPKAVALVHYAGLPGNIRSIKQICDSYKMELVEDACHAIGATYKSGAGSEPLPVGSCSDSLAACFSFHPVKHIAIGEGGAVTTSSRELAEKISLLRTHGITKDPHKYARVDRARTHARTNAWYHEMQFLGFNYRLSEIQAALGISQLRRLPENIAARRRIAQIYREEFAKLQAIARLPEDSEHGSHAYHLFPLEIDFDVIKQSKAWLVDQLSQAGIGTQVHYIPVYWHPFYENNPHLWLKTSCPVAEKYYGMTLSIPMYHSIDEGGIERVVEAVKKSLEAR